MRVRFAPMFRLSSRSFVIEKDGEHPEDCQDSIFPDPRSEPTSRSSDEDGKCFAVSDGTTTSFFSRSWAGILTRQFAEKRDLAFSDWDTWLEGARATWLREIEQRASAKDVSFYTKNDFLLKKPAAATFTGLHFGRNDGDATHWEALALGDSCLFHFQENGEVTSYPFSESASFEFVTESAESYAKRSAHRPLHITTEPVPDAEGVRRAKPAREGDIFLLATDALAKWLLVRKESGQPVWGTLLKLHEHQAFVNFVHAARRETAQPLNNDDVALAVICLGEPHAEYLAERNCYTPASRPSGIRKSLGGRLARAPDGMPPPSPITPVPSARQHSRRRASLLFWVTSALSLILVCIVVSWAIPDLLQMGANRQLIEEISQKESALKAKEKEKAQLKKEIAQLQRELKQLRKQLETVPTTSPEQAVNSGRKEVEPDKKSAPTSPPADSSQTGLER